MTRKPSRSLITTRESFRARVCARGSALYASSAHAMNPPPSNATTPTPTPIAISSFFTLIVLQKAAELIKTALPRLPVFPDPVLQDLESRRIQAAHAYAPRLVRLEQCTGLKNAQMLGYSRDCDTERPGKVRYGHWTGT